MGIIVQALKNQGKTGLLIIERFFSFSGRTRVSFRGKSGVPVQ